MTKGGDVMDPWSVALLALTGGFMGAWVASAIFIRPSSKTPTPPPAPVSPPLASASLLPPDLQAELEDAARERREAFAEVRVARMRREARDARADASATSAGVTAGGGASSAPPPPPPSSSSAPTGTPRPGQGFFWTVPVGLPREGGYFRLPTVSAAGGATEFRCPCGHRVPALPPRRPGRGIRPDTVALEGHYQVCGTCQAAVHV